tara:strand:- start:446 stop:670 length:225 start_codon:yes stop_codon:yes gene_type:complete
MANENKKFIVTPENPKGILKSMTKKEIDQRKKDKERQKKDIEEKETKQAKKESGKQKLKDLGLDDDEIKALLGV